MHTKRTLLALALAAVIAVPAAAIDPDCTADIFPNGRVDAFDILVVSGSMGPCGSFCPGDVNGNGYVGALDLARVVANVGDCPCIGDTEPDGDVDADDADVSSVLFTWCPDLDGNGRVDEVDELIVLASFDTDPDLDAVAAADINGDGVVNIDDYDIVHDELGKNCRMDVDFNLEIEVVDAAVIAGLIGACP